MASLRSSPAGGDKQPFPDIRLRAWQQEAFGVYRDALSRGVRNILWEATPGAGKTTGALVVCLHQLRRAGARGVLVVVPTAHLKIQWARAAARLGIHLDTSFSSAAGTHAGDYHGCVVTYQQIAQDPTPFKALCKGGCVILDEVHHAGDGLSWGSAIRTALAEAQFVLCLSGTPFRSDLNPIPFVEYNDEGLSIPDYSYSYTRAVEDGVCRPTAFFSYGGEVSWLEKGGPLRASFTDNLDPIASSRRLRAALDPESGWIRPMLHDAHEMLMTTRRDHPDAGGLLVAANQTQARKLAKLLASITNTSPKVVLSEDSEASKRLKDFQDSNAPWLVACNMVSEGVDIPRLRVGVYATAIRTKMYFRQFLGRIVRRVPHISALQVAYCYLPSDPQLEHLAREIEGELRHCIRRVDGEEMKEEQREAKERATPVEQAWQALESTNSGINAVIVHGNQLNLFAPSGDVEAIRSAVDEQVLARLDEKRSKSEEKAALSLEIRKLVGLFHKQSGKSHATIHSFLNMKQGVRSQPLCTEKQLGERILLLKDLLSGRKVIEAPSSRRVGGMR